MPSHPLILIRFLLPVLLFAIGCTHYEYEVVEPTDFAGHIGTKSSFTIPLKPIRYEARSANDRLVLFIHNESDGPVKLLGEDGFAVDPNGESHPLPTRTIAPGTSTKLIMPPVRPTFRQSNPTFGLGVGIGLGSARRHGHYGGRYGYDPFYGDSPRYYRLEDDGTVYWNWNGETEVKLRLVYQLGEKNFHHDFRFRRVKM